MHSPKRASIVLAAASLTLVFASYFYVSTWRRQKLRRRGLERKGLIQAIGNTPLIKITSLSEVTGCQIFAKAEFLNPGGSIKDRVAVKIIEEALQAGRLRVGGLVIEGSAGSTAISLATVAPAYGCKCHVIIPDDAAIEKAQMLEALGATVERVRPVSISHRDHFVNIARRKAAAAEASYIERTVLLDSFDIGKSKAAQINEAASFCTGSAAVNVLTSIKGNGCEQAIGMESTNKHVEQTKLYRTQANIYQRGDNVMPSAYEDECKGGFFADQFENLANFRAHYHGTGPEIWAQTGGKVHAFVAAAGTGGTIAGISQFLKEQNNDVKCFLIDVPGSALFNWVTRGVMYTREEAEGKRLKNPFDTITEGIGINRLTQNFKLVRLD